MKKHVKILAILTVFTMLFFASSCSNKEYDYTSLNDSHINSTKLNEQSKVAVPTFNEDEENQIAKLVKRGYSNYGYIQLNDELKEAYKSIEFALFNLEEKLAVNDITFENLNMLLRYISSDNPLFFWEPNEINYTQRVGGGYIMNFKYAFTKEEVYEYLLEIDEFSTDFCSAISPSLSSFDKALLVHDFVVNNIEYDKTLIDPWRNDVYGGLINNYSACLGYSKTYQYLMCRLGIDTLMAYGYGGDEQHAWNVINLDGEYYHVDTTFNDTSKVFSTGSDYSKVQHEYTFLSDDDITKTHEILSEKFSSYKLPECNSTQKNYFNMKNLVVTTSNMDTLNSELDVVINNAISIALAEKNSLIEIKFENDDIAKEVMRTIENGEVDSKVTMLCKMRGINSVDSRSFSYENRILSYYFS